MLDASDPRDTTQLLLPSVTLLVSAPPRPAGAEPPAAGDTIRVAPERLVARAADGRLGDIAASGAADRPAQGTIRRPFTHAGSLWTVITATETASLPRYQAVRLVPAETAEATGPVVDFRNARYILGRDPVRFEAGDPLAPQIPRAVPSLETLETLLAEFWESGACLLALDARVTARALRSAFAQLGIRNGYEWTSHLPGAVLVYDPVRLQQASGTTLHLADYLLQSLYDGSLPAVLERAQRLPRQPAPPEGTAPAPPCEGPTHTVSPARLLWGTSGTKGDIRLSQTDPYEGVVHAPFLFEGALWVWTGGDTCGDALAYRLTPRPEFQGPVTSAAERFARDPTSFAYRVPHPPEGAWHGLPVRFRDHEYILTGPPHRFTAPEPAMRLAPRCTAEAPRALFHTLATFWMSGEPWLPLQVRCLVPVRAMLACLGLTEHQDYGIACDLPGTGVLLVDLPQAQAWLKAGTEAQVTDRLVSVLYDGRFEALDRAARAGAIPRQVPNAVAEAEFEMRLATPGDPVQDGLPTAPGTDPPRRERAPRPRVLPRLEREEHPCRLPSPHPK